MAGQGDNGARTNVGVTVTKYMPAENKVELSNGMTYTYKALVLATGFDH